MAFILSEDEALKAKLEGLTVNDINNPNRPVPVWFRFPEMEARTITYPNIIIERIGLERDTDREHRGYIELGYYPDAFEQAEDPTDLDTGLFTDFPIPYLFSYAVVIQSRNILHDISLQSQLTQVQYLPSRFGYLEIPEDGTIRRLDVEGPENLDTIVDNKRLFRKAYSVSVSSELTLAEVDEIVRVTTVDLDLYDLDDPDFTA